MATIKETLEACQVVVNMLAVNREGFTYKPASMVELSGHISVAIERLNKRRVTLFTCANCGSFQKEDDNVLDLDSGTTFKCSACEKDTVFLLTTVSEYKTLVDILKGKNE